MKNVEKSSRQLKVANLIKQSLVEIFARGRKLDLYLIENKITITNVEVSQDLKHANCYFLPFGTKIDSKKILDALDSSKFAIRHQVTETINMKFSPELKFYYDKGLENSIEVESVLKKVL